MENRGRKQEERAPGNDRTGIQNGAAWLASDTVRRVLQIALGLVAGFILGAMAVQSWTDQSNVERDAREKISDALEQGSVPFNLFFSETTARIAALGVLAEDAPGYALRLDPGYRRYGKTGAPVSGGPALPEIADAASVASKTGFPALSRPFQATGLWYAAIVTERRDRAGAPAGYEGLQFPLSRMLGLWSGVRMPPGTAMALMSQDRRIWLRAPFIPSLIGAPASDDPFMGAVPGDAAHVLRIVDYDAGGVDALVGWRPLESYGLVLAVGVDRDQLAGGGSSYFSFLLALLMTGGMFLVATFMGRISAAAGPPPERMQPPAPGAPERPAPDREAAPVDRGLGAIGETIPVVVYQQRVGPDFAVTFDYVSPGIREIHGVEPKQLKDRPQLIFEMVHEDDRERVEDAFEEAWRSGHDLDTEYRIVTPDGTAKRLHNLARAAAGKVGVWDGIVLDVTGQDGGAPDSGEMVESNGMTSAVRAEFLAKVAHELTTPLNAIMGYSDMIGTESHGPIGSEKYLEFAGNIHMGVEHMQALIEDILDLSRIERGQAVLFIEDSDAEELVDSCLRLIQGRAADARLELRRRIEESLPKLRVDSLKIRQILINLLTNAIKFTPSGGTVTLTAATTAEGGVLFAVRDTGVGIAAKDMATAVETYGRIEQESGIRIEGLGLGLSLAKALAELHGGALSIESEVGKGTTVEVRLPASCIAPAKRTDT